MSEIECAQLHSDLFRRRHSTLQSHGLFALAKHLFILLLETYWSRSGAGAERAKNLVSGSGAVSGCEKN